MSNIRHNYSEECEALVNKHINTKLCHGYIYLYMCSYYNRDDQALPGFADFFWKASEEEYKHAGMLIKYQTMRGGRVILQDITKPTVMEWNTPLEAMMTVLHMEKEVTKTLTDLESLATTKTDFHLVSFIQKNFLTRQVTKTLTDLENLANTKTDFHLVTFIQKKFLTRQIIDIKTIGDFLTKMKRVGTGLCFYMMDKEIAPLHQEVVREH